MGTVEKAIGCTLVVMVQVSGEMREIEINSDPEKVVHITRERAFVHLPDSNRFRHAHPVVRAHSNRLLGGVFLQHLARGPATQSLGRAETHVFHQRLDLARHGLCDCTRVPRAPPRPPSQSTGLMRFRGSFGARGRHSTRCVLT